MGGVLPKPVTTKVLERKGTKDYAVGVCSINGYRENMEDAHTIHFDTANGAKSWAMFGIFDGHVSEKCSLFVAQAMPQALQAVGTKVPLPDADMQKLALKVDKDWVDLKVDGGSTGTWCVAHKEGGKVKLQIGNVGDSRILISRPGGVLEAVTNDHKPENPNERRRIEDCGGSVENNRVDGSLAVSRAFGDADYKRSEPTSDQLRQKVIALADITHADITLGADEFIMLICDGVYEGDFTNAQIVEYATKEMKKTDDIAAVCALVCEEAISRGSRDNISCMIVKCVDGTSYAGKYKQDEVIPGPYLCPDSRPFVTAYKKMLEYGPHKLTLGQALLARYTYVKSTLPSLIEKYKNTKDEDLEPWEVRAIVNPSQAQRAAFNEMSRTMQLQQISLRRARGEAVLPNFVQDMQAEMDAFGSGPPAGATPAQQVQWFEEWVTQQTANQPASGGAGGPMGGIGGGGSQGEVLQRVLALQQQLGLPLHVLLNLLARDGQGNGREGP
eukprot:PhF_6_TR7028/c0_g1_i1/m.10520/K04461/PPM1B, PP2CB; protein phosphatase 1B